MSSWNCPSVWEALLIDTKQVGTQCEKNFIIFNELDTVPTLVVCTGGCNITRQACRWLWEY